MITGVRLAWASLSILWLFIIALLFWYTTMQIQLSIISNQKWVRSLQKERGSRRQNGFYDDDRGGGVMAMHDRAEDSLLALGNNSAKERGLGFVEDLSTRSGTKVYQIRSTPRDRQRRRRQQLRREDAVVMRDNEKNRVV